MLVEYCAALGLQPFDAGFYRPACRPDDLDDLEVSDVEVYWGLVSQLRAATQGRSPGSPIRRVHIDDDATSR